MGTAKSQCTVTEVDFCARLQTPRTEILWSTGIRGVKQTVLHIIVDKFIALGFFWTSFAYLCVASVRFPFNNTFSTNHKLFITVRTLPIESPISNNWEDSIDKFNLYPFTSKLEVKVCLSREYPRPQTMHQENVKLNIMFWHLDHVCHV